MMRVFALAMGLSLAAICAQFPEFSQQYAQRLAGKVEELQRFVQEFDRDAFAIGVSREQALIDLASSGAIGAQRAQTIVSTIDREKRLNLVLNDLRNANAIEQVIIINNSVDRDVARGTLHDFKPALPLTYEGFLFALIGFVAGISGFGLIGVAYRQATKKRGHTALSRRELQVKRH